MRQWTDYITITQLPETGDTKTDTDAWCTGNDVSIVSFALYMDGRADTEAVMRLSNLLSSNETT